MFTGIVREVATVAAVEGGEGGRTLVVDAPGAAGLSVVGDSVALDGCCLTVTVVDGALLTFHAVAETLARTTIGALVQGDTVNVEPALRAGEPLGGHYVQGHVDGVGRICSVEPEGEGTRVWIEAGPELLRLCVEKGSVTVDGVSLTVAELDGGAFAVALVPHTLASTTLGAAAPGAAVNLEADVIAKYVARLLDARPAEAPRA